MANDRRMPPRSNNSNRPFYADRNGSGNRFSQNPPRTGGYRRDIPRAVYDDDDEEATPARGMNQKRAYPPKKANSELARPGFTPARDGFRKAPARDGERASYPFKKAPEREEGRASYSFKKAPAREEGRAAYPFKKAPAKDEGRTSYPFRPAPQKPAVPDVREEDDFEREERPRYTPAPVADMPENLLVGRNPIREAIRADRPIEKLLVARGDLSGAARDIVRMAKEKDVLVQEVERTRLDQIYPNHQGLLAYVSSANYAEMEDVYKKAEEKGEDLFVILLDGITDPHNLGAIIRSAECVGAHGVIIPERRSAGLNPACVKAAAGALEYMPVVRVTNLNRTIDELKERGVWVTAADMDGEDVYRCDLTGPIALVIGSEGDGVSELALKKSDRRISLPMSGHLDSLNASVAAGVIMYAVMNARR